ncbi:uncharacterized protein LY79DRAFT_670533 [Colletotrichum navitas]|uniref:Uncharacterized protein n=1 Tax=Colletotrichum navitas TaxID=681940 RepID=A0AAD8V3R3_9PEZI|nr:uncharacterized protein LY79DRAFT_670533 [Colletotrichum navitas]KAK1586087.1 hypothetical protein LY79DRAFT_670533 [Colletotrichum navitas]
MSDSKKHWSNLGIIMETAPVTLSDMYGMFHDAVAKHYRETGEIVAYTYINVVKAYVDWLMWWRACVFARLNNQPLPTFPAD